jgi:hypothetical protein
MLTNDLLPEMSVEDINRRYRGSYVRYDNRIVLVDEFITRESFIYTTRKGVFHKAFDWRLLDISRPIPQWFMFDDKAFYIYYPPARQWHRGFCANNTVIRDRHGSQQRWPGPLLFAMLEKAYEETPRLSVTTAEVMQRCAEMGFAVLSPQVLVNSSKNKNGEISMEVLFREMPIGSFGRVVPAFEHEMKELIGDYVNVNDVSVVPVSKRSAKEKAVLRELGDILGENGFGGEFDREAVRGAVARLRPFIADDLDDEDEGGDAAEPVEHVDGDEENGW